MQRDKPTKAKSFRNNRIRQAKAKRIIYTLRECTELLRNSLKTY
nr:MAG TPA: hypothetical protein [Caudoviricetes sp.]